METLSYLAKTNLYLVLFYGCYWLFFRQHTFFKWNRFYLLASIGAAFLLPAITFWVPAPVLETSYDQQTTQLIPAVTETVEAPFNWAMLVAGCYLAGVMVMTFRLLSSFQKLFSLLRQGERIRTEAYTLLLLDNGQLQNADTGSFSFFKWLIVNRADYENNPDGIIRHEYVHIRQWHSFDVVLIELLKVVFWFNPVVWMYKRSIQAVHEYLADVEAPNRDRYASFLVSYALKVPEQVLANHFANSSLLKNRIQMIYKNRTSKWLLGKYALIVPLTAITVFLTASRTYLPAPERENPAVNESFGIDIKGTVSDKSGNKIADAIVIVKGTNQGAPTDKQGKYELRNVPEHASIVVSHVQFKSQEMTIVKNKLTYDFTLEAANELTKADHVSQTAQPATPKTNTDGLAIAEQKPQFPGGHQAMLEYLKTNTKYPESASKALVSGSVFVRFTVAEEGSIGNIVIVRGVGFGLDAEAIRLVKNMPKWEPAIQNGKPLSVAQNIEIRFDLPVEKSDKRQGFHLPEQPAYAINFQVAKVEIEELFNSSLNFFEPKTFKPSLNPPKAEYKYQSDSSSYRFMNYQTSSQPNYGMTLQTTGKYKYLKESAEKSN
ncbi:M56 family metallopeptidase [Dyadobacter sp. CY343]|uniref:M56 family metallopeptidase n=1 Tax=Dyadobacter sp. CY343 TaxID=2907299 RepID=UPI001F196E20|nr:M56 family metallopeptidase [Dyadobacter sp. CY343]MCE7063446.1 M56 family metallopeptidase [Dyadobacter sp. CY343]